MTTPTIPPPRQRESVPLRYALDRYQAWRVSESDASPLTWAGEKATLLSFLDAMLQRGRQQIGDVTDEDVVAWWGWQSTLAKSTKSTRLSQLRGFLGHCRKRGWIDTDPTWRISARKPKPAARPRLDAEELLAVQQSAEDPRDRVLLALCNNLALRGSEIVPLRIKHLHLDDGEVEVYVDKTEEPDLMEVSTDLDTELRRWLHIYQAAAPQVGRDSYLVPARWRSTVSTRINYKPDTPLSQPHRHVQRALLRAVRIDAIDPGEWAELDADGDWKLKTGEGVHTIRRSVARVFFDAAQAETGSFDEALLATMALLHHARPERTLDYIGVSRRVQARARILKGRPFLTRLTGVQELPALRVV